MFEQSGFAQVAGQLDISGHILQLRDALTQERFRPPHLRYLSYDPGQNNFQLLLDKGTLKNSQTKELEGSTEKLLKYFLVGVSLPNESFWVNLRPDSPDNIIDDYLGRTDVGKILLEADLQLKKDTAKFTSPETPEGKKYWDKLYKKAGELLGNENITIPTLTRPWIVPGEIIIRETDTNAYIYKATLKVMLEQDYLKDSSAYNFKDERLKELNAYSSELIRELIIPKITQEINTSKKYAPLRQVYYSLILAQWFKDKFYGKSGVYCNLIDRRDLNGLISKEDWSKNNYFSQYKESFQKGEYNFKIPHSTPYGQVIRSYFSGGVNLANLGGGPGAGSPVIQKVIPPDRNSPLPPGLSKKPHNKGFNVTGILPALIISAAAVLGGGSSADAQEAAPPKESTPIPIIEGEFSSKKQQEQQLIVNQKEVDELIKQLGDDDIFKREEASTRLAAIGMPVVPSLLKAKDSAKDAEVIARSSAVIKKIAQAKYSPIFKALEDPKWQDIVLKTLRDGRLPGIIVNEPLMLSLETLLGAQKDNDASVRAVREGAIELIVESLRNMLQTPQEKYPKIVGAIVKLDKNATDTLLPLLDLVGPGWEFVRETAIGGLNELGADAEKAIPTLERLSKHPDKRTREVAENALKNIRRAIEEKKESPKQKTEGPGGVIGQVTGVVEEEAAARAKEAEKLIHRDIPPAQAIAVQKAHEVGPGHGYIRNPDGSLSKRSDDKAYTPQEIAQKARILEEAGFSREERRILIENGIVGETIVPEVAATEGTVGRRGFLAKTLMGLAALATTSNTEIFGRGLQSQAEDKTKERVESILKQFLAGSIDAGGAVHELDRSSEGVDRMQCLIQILQDKGREERVQTAIVTLIEEWASGPYRYFRFDKSTWGGKERYSLVKDKLIPSLIKTAESRKLASPSLRSVARILGQIGFYRPKDIEIVTELISGLRRLKQVVGAEFYALEELGNVIGMLSHEDKNLARRHALDLISEIKTMLLGIDLKKAKKLKADSITAKSAELYIGNCLDAWNKFARILPDGHPQEKLITILNWRWNSRRMSTDTFNWEKAFAEGAASFKDIFTIYDNQEFLSATKDFEPTHQFSIASAVQLTLKRFRRPVKEENIKNVLPFILAAREKYAKRAILSKNRELILGVHEELPETKFYKNFINQLDSLYGQGKYLQHTGPKSKIGILNRIKGSSSEATIWLYGHGGPYHFWLRGGKFWLTPESPKTEESNDLENPYAISYKELSDALISRAKLNNGKLSDLTIIVDACFSSDYIVKVLNYLAGAFKTKEIIDLPVIITMAERGAKSWLSAFSPNVITQEAKDRKELLLSDIYKQENEKKTKESEDLTFFLPLEEQELKNLKAALGVKEEEPGQILPGKGSVTELYDSINPSLPILDSGFEGTTGQVGTGDLDILGAPADAVIEAIKSGALKLTVDSGVVRVNGKEIKIVIDNQQQRFGHTNETGTEASINLAKIYEFLKDKGLTEEEKQAALERILIHEITEALALQLGLNSAEAHTSAMMAEAYHANLLQEKEVIIDAQKIRDAIKEILAERDQRQKRELKDGQGFGGEGNQSSGGTNQADTFDPNKTAVLPAAFRPIITPTLELRPMMAQMGLENGAIIGDVHGKLQVLRNWMERFEYVKKGAAADGSQDEWVAPQGTELIQGGDLIDRTPKDTHPLATIRYMLLMQEKAAAKGSRVKILLGNHELIYLMRYAEEEAKKAGRRVPQNRSVLESMRKGMEGYDGLNPYAFDQQVWGGYGPVKIGDIEVLPEADAEKLEAAAEKNRSELIELLKQAIRQGRIVASYATQDTVFCHGVITNKALEEIRSEAEAQGLLRPGEALDNPKIFARVVNAQINKAVEENNFESAIFSWGENGEAEGIFDVRLKNIILGPDGLYSPKGKAQLDRLPFNLFAFHDPTLFRANKNTLAKEDFVSKADNKQRFVICADAGSYTDIGATVVVKDGWIYEAQRRLDIPQIERFVYGGSIEIGTKPGQWRYLDASKKRIHQIGSGVEAERLISVEMAQRLGLPNTAVGMFISPFAGGFPDKNITGDAKEESSPIEEFVALVEEAMKAEARNDPDTHRGALEVAAMKFYQDIMLHEQREKGLATLLSGKPEVRQYLELQKVAEIFRQVWKEEIMEAKKSRQQPLAPEDMAAGRIPLPTLATPTPTQAPSSKEKTPSRPSTRMAPFEKADKSTPAPKTPSVASAKTPSIELQLVERPAASSVEKSNDAEVNAFIGWLQLAAETTIVDLHQQGIHGCFSLCRTSFAQNQERLQEVRRIIAKADNRLKEFFEAHVQEFEKIIAETNGIPQVPVVAAPTAEQAVTSPHDPDVSASTEDPDGRPIITQTKDSYIVTIYAYSYKRVAPIKIIRSHVKLDKNGQYTPDPERQDVLYISQVKVREKGITDQQLEEIRKFIRDSEELNGEAWKAIKENRAADAEKLFEGSDQLFKEAQKKAEELGILSNDAAGEIKIDLEGETLPIASASQGQMEKQGITIQTMARLQKLTSEYRRLEFKALEARKKIKEANTKAELEAKAAEKENGEAAAKALRDARRMEEVKEEAQVQALHEAVNKKRKFVDIALEDLGLRSNKETVDQNTIFLADKVKELQESAQPATTINLDEGGRIVKNGVATVAQVKLKITDIRYGILEAPSPDAHINLLTAVEKYNEGPKARLKAAEQLIVEQNTKFLAKKVAEAQQPAITVNVDAGGMIVDSGGALVELKITDIRYGILEAPDPDAHINLRKAIEKYNEGPKARLEADRLRAERQAKDKNQEQTKNVEQTLIQPPSVEAAPKPEKIDSRTVKFENLGQSAPAAPKAAAQAVKEFLDLIRLAKANMLGEKEGMELVRQKYEEVSADPEAKAQLDSALKAPENQELVGFLQSQKKKAALRLYTQARLEFEKEVLDKLHRLSVPELQKKIDELLEKYTDVPDQSIHYILLRIQRKQNELLGQPASEAITDANRRAVAEWLLGRTLNDLEAKALQEAHEKGEGHYLGTRNSDGTYNKDSALPYTPQEIAEKARILKAAGFSNEEIRILMENGVAGEAAAKAKSAISIIHDYYEGDTAPLHLKAGDYEEQGGWNAGSKTSDLLRIIGMLSGKEMVLDLGSGRGKAVAMFSQRAKRAVGIELVESRFKESQKCIADLSKKVNLSNVELINGDFLDDKTVDFSQFDLVYIYWPNYEGAQGQEVLNKLEAKLVRELKPGAKFVISRIGEKIEFKNLKRTQLIESSPAATEDLSALEVKRYMAVYEKQTQGSADEYEILRKADRGVYEKLKQAEQLYDATFGRGSQPDRTYLNGAIDFYAEAIEGMRKLNLAELQSLIEGAEIHHQDLLIARSLVDVQTRGTTWEGRLITLQKRLVEKIKEQGAKQGAGKPLVIVDFGIGSEGAPTTFDLVKVLSETGLRNVRVIGIDINPEHVRKARQRLSQTALPDGISLEFISGGFRLTEENNLSGVSMIITSNVMQYYKEDEWKENEKLLRQALAGDGVLVVSYGPQRGYGGDIYYTISRKDGSVEIEDAVSEEEVLETAAQKPVSDDSTLDPSLRSGSMPDKNAGGIDFRALPIVTQPILNSPLPAARLEPPRVSLNSENEWQKIERTLQAGIIPSTERLKEYLENCSGGECFDKDLGKVLSCIADILRLEEERCCLTEESLKELLVLIEAGKPVADFNFSLSKIKVLPQEPKTIDAFVVEDK